MSISPIGQAIIGLLLINLPLIAYGIYAKRKSDRLAHEIERHEVQERERTQG